MISVGQTVTVKFKSTMSGCILGQNAVGSQPQGVFEVSRTGGDSEGTNTYTAGNVGASQFTFFCDGGNNTDAAGRQRDPADCYRSTGDDCLDFCAG